MLLPYGYPLVWIDGGVATKQRESSKEATT